MNIRIIITLYLFLLINTDIPTINFSSELKSREEDGFSLEGDYLTIKTYPSRHVWYINGNNFNDYTTNRFMLTGTNVDKTIIINSTSFIYLNALTLTSKESPIIIEKNCQVEFILTGKSSLINSAVSENMGNIYLKEGAKLTISGQGTLNLIVNKFLGIYGEKSSSFEMREGTLKIISTENSVGGIHINGDIYFTNSNFYFEDISGENPVISTNQSIIINSGNLNIISNGTVFDAQKSIIINSGNLNISTESINFAINSGNSIFIKGGNINLLSSVGSGIHAGQNFYFGIKDEDNNSLKLNINSSGKGLEAQRIEIFSGNITIESKSDGISLLNDCCKENPEYANTTCYIKIYGGDILINSEKNGINSVGNIYIAGGKTIIYAGKNYSSIVETQLLKITKGIFFAGGAKGFEENITETTQTFLVYNKSLAANSVISIYDTNKLASDIKLKKDIDYFYINYPSNYELKIDEYKKETNIRILKAEESQDEDEKSDNINLTENEKNTYEKSQNGIYTEKIDNNIKDNILLTEQEQTQKVESTVISNESIQNKKPTTNLLTNRNIGTNYNSEKLDPELNSAESISEQEEQKQNQKTDSLNNYENNQDSSNFIYLRNLLILFMIWTILYI